MTRGRRWQVTVGAGFLALLLLAVVHLDRWPVTWFDEGSHLHVPKTLLQHGAYADSSSDGLRYHGPTMGVGPTVMLPVAGALWLGGVGLWQARLVMAAFLVAAAMLHFLVARELGGRVVALLATLLAVTSPGVDLVEYGRQVLGEVPGAAFLLAGLLLWFRAGRGVSGARLVVVGACFGLAAVTKHVYLLTVGPALLTAWALGRLHRHPVASREFVVPAVVMLALAAGWQLVLVGLLGPGRVAENLALLRETTSGAALVFDPSLVRASTAHLLGPQGYGGLVVPAVVYSLMRGRRGSAAEWRWTLVSLLVASNLAWFVTASTGWPRYAFPGLLLGGTLVARLARDAWRLTAHASGRLRAHAWASRVAIATWLAALVILPAGALVGSIVFPPPADAARVARWLDANVPRDVEVATWEQELGFLTDHRYRFPPQRLLAVAVAHKFHGGPPPAHVYDFREDRAPRYVVTGAFSTWVRLHADAGIADDYDVVFTTGSYAVWRRRPGREPAAGVPGDRSGGDRSHDP